MWCSGYQHQNQIQTSLKAWVTKWMLFKSSGAATIRPLLLHKHLIWPQATSQSCHLQTGWALPACLLSAVLWHDDHKIQRTETKIFLDTSALFFVTKDSEGTSEFPALSSPQAQLCALKTRHHGGWGCSNTKSSMLSRLPKTQRRCLQNFVISWLNLLSKYIFHGQI